MATSDALVDAPAAGPLRALRLLVSDPFALAAAIFLVLLVAGAVLGPWLLEELATRPQLRMRNAPPFTLEHGWGYILGADSLGRSILARLLVAARSTLTIAAAAVAIAMVFGAALGLLAGFTRSWVGDLVMRLTDIVMSFPSTLLAVVILYTFRPSIATLVAVLAITRLPVYIRTTRAEVLEIRERMFVSAARVMGASSLRIALRHVLPMVLPTLLTIATVEFADRDARRIGPELPRHRHPAARGHLGPDGGAGPRLSGDRLVAVVLPGRRDHADDAGAQPALRLDADRDRSRCSAGAWKCAGGRT